ncbi:hypothetical protein NHG23_04560 [Aerococcaceae bacterium NML190073]|nr:hypothetical protein [Aerococcaceae bacterium NML190073]MCW6664971.1 hypothetical protein [Aerococcaceae bacterium NML191219]MCW6675210.1 hypothetical protein [Aerococcaceae bacterium NML171108]MCW6680807.1 hypothetical protein [Aerococcaceae bacterium NML130460]
MSDSFKLFFRSAKRGVSVAGGMVFISGAIGILLNQPFRYDSLMFPILIGAIDGLRVYWRESTAAVAYKVVMHFMLLWGMLFIALTMIQALSGGILFNVLAAFILSTFFTGLQAVFVK